MSFAMMYDILRDLVCVDDEALDLVFSINGCNEETASDILFYYTGWHNFEGFLDELNDD